MDRAKNISLVVLILLTIGAFGYIGYDKYSDATQEKQVLIFEEGAKYGYTQAVTQVMQNAVTCKQVPLTIENQTISLIWTECLRE